MSRSRPSKKDREVMEWWVDSGLAEEWRYQLREYGYVELQDEYVEDGLRRINLICEKRWTTLRPASVTPRGDFIPSRLWDETTPSTITFATVAQASKPI